MRMLSKLLLQNVGRSIAAVTSVFNVCIKCSITNTPAVDYALKCDRIVITCNSKPTALSMGCCIGFCKAFDAISACCQVYEHSYEDYNCVKYVRGNVFLPRVRERMPVTTEKVNGTRMWYIVQHGYYYTVG